MSDSPRRDPSAQVGALNIGYQFVDSTDAGHNTAPQTIWFHHGETAGAPA